MNQRLQKKLRQLEGYNRLRSLQKPAGIDLTSNDYLGFKNHPLLMQAAIEALEIGIDIGAGGSRLLRGNTGYHDSLEARAAEFFGTEKTLYFATGFQANYALYTTLLSRHDIIIYDEHVHASVRDGIAASHAKAQKFRHNDLDALEDTLKTAYKLRKQNGQIWLSIESLYSMDGDLAPVREICDLAKSYEAILIVDEAHMTGVNIPHGRGVAFGLGENVITVHTCGKALGTAGGFICASAEIIDTLINTARPFIYSTAPMPLQAYLTEKAIDLAAGKEGENQRQKLQKIVDHARLKLDNPNLTQIVPIILGSDETALSAAKTLQGEGYDIRAIRPPTVPEGTARLRLSLSSNTEQKAIDEVLCILSSFSSMNTC